MTAVNQRLTKEKEKIESECQTINKQYEESKQSNNDLYKSFKQTKDTLEQVQQKLAEITNQEQNLAVEKGKLEKQFKKLSEEFRNY